MPMKKKGPGQKMVQLKIRFWARGLTGKNVWSSGTVGLEANPTHGITASRDIPFNSLMQLSAKIEELLIRRGIKVRRAGKMTKYMK